MKEYDDIEYRYPPGYKHKKKRKRIDYRKEPLPNYPIYPMYSWEETVTVPDAIEFYETRPVTLDWVAPGYIVNSIGQLFDPDGNFVEQKLINSGYYVYYLRTKSGSTKMITAHKLFMSVFNPIPNANEYSIDHHDFDRSNNSLSNLFYITQDENNKRKNQLNPNHGSSNYQASFTKSQLEVIVREIDKGTSYKDILEMIGIENTDNNRDYIGNIKRGITYIREAEEIRNKLSSTTIES